MSLDVPIFQNKIKKVCYNPLNRFSANIIVNNSTYSEQIQKEHHFCLKMQLFLHHTESSSLITYQSFVKRSKDQAHLLGIKQWCFTDISFFHRFQFVRSSEYVLHVFDLLMEYAITALKPKKKASYFSFVFLWSTEALHLLTIYVKHIQRPRWKFY